jgi:hypothetical protein
MHTAHATQSLGLAVQRLIGLRLRQLSPAPVHAFNASLATPGKIPRGIAKLRGMANEIPDVNDLVALGYCALTPQLL